MHMGGFNAVLAVACEQHAVMDSTLCRLPQSQPATCWFDSRRPHLSIHSCYTSPQNSLANKHTPYFLSTTICSGVNSQLNWNKNWPLNHTPKNTGPAWAHGGGSRYVGSACILATAACCEPPSLAAADSRPGRMASAAACKRQALQHGCLQWLLHLPLARPVHGTPNCLRPARGTGHAKYYQAASCRLGV